MFDTVFGWFTKPSEVTIPLPEPKPVEVPVGNGMSELPPGVIHKVKNWKLSETGGWKRFVLLQEYGAAEPNWVWQESTLPIKDNLGG
jgi:hypothetical protein